MLYRKQLVEKRDPDSGYRDQLHQREASRMVHYIRILKTVSLAFAVGGTASCALVCAQAPGPELFAKEPRTPLELWDAIDYLLRTNQAQKALPYIDRFVKSKPDDATLIAIRNQYGPGSILRLSDYALTRPFAQPMAEAMVVAAHKYATRPERLTQLVSDLIKTPEEQAYAVRHLREAGPGAIPFLVEMLSRPDLPDKDRTSIIRNMGQLDYSVIPPLVAVVDSSDPVLAANAATALGMIGSKEAIPFLTFPAAFPDASRELHTAAQAAITQLTAKPFLAQPHRPAQVLINAAWRYHRHQVQFGSDPIMIWTWNNNQKALTARQVSRTEAEGIIGIQLTQQALRLEPDNHEAQVAQLSLTLEKAIERIGFDSFVTRDAPTFNMVKASGPSIVNDLVRVAIADGKAELAAVGVIALGQIIDRTALTATGQPHPLVEALYAPMRQVQFAAAKALIGLAPIQPFPGSSRVIPTLARFVMNQALPRAIVIDGNPTRGSQLAGFLISLGYDSELELNGANGFRAAAESADVALILLSSDLFRSGWALTDTLANLKADSRTAAIPVFIYGPLNVQYKHPSLERDYRGIKFLVQPVSTDLLLQQLKALPTLSGDNVRTTYAREATALLARVAAERKGPFSADLLAAEQALAVALNNAQTASEAATALREVSDPDAQRSLADVVLDPSKAPIIRKHSASELVHSIQRFGRLITATQETRLAAAIREETDPDIRASLLAILHTLVPPPLLGSPKPLMPAIPHGSSETLQIPPAAIVKPH